GRTYMTHHPGPADVGLLVEVAESSLHRDRNEKARIYAEAAIPFYWIVNLVDCQIEEYSQPSGAGNASGYAQRQDFAVGTRVPLILDGITVATVAANDLLP